MDEELVNVTFKMPKELRRQFKIVCAENGETMTSVFVAIAREAVKIGADLRREAGEGETP